MQKLQKTFESGKTIFIAFLTAGYPNIDATVELVLEMEKNGVDVIELGFPFSDPLADGPTIQYANEISLKNGMNVDKYLNIVAEIRKHSDIPLLMMTYYNVVLQYGLESLSSKMQKLKMNGFIIVDLPMDTKFVHVCSKYDLTFIPFITPLTPSDRMRFLLKQASTFVYVVSRLGVTGNSTDFNEKELESYLASIRKFSRHPLAVGFGVRTPVQFLTIGKFAEGVVIGSEIIKLIRDNQNYKLAVSEFVKSISDVKSNKQFMLDSGDSESAEDIKIDLPGMFGEFGGSYIPEILHFCLNQLSNEFEKCKSDKEFWNEFYDLYSYVGRPTPLYFASRLSKHAGGAKIWLKREDLTHTGSHKINNAIGQALLAKRLGKKRIIAETGAGQHGVATATVCAKLGLDCVVYMGREDTERQELNVFRMKMLGAKVVPVESGSKTLKDAINEAMRDWVTNVGDTHYLVGSAIGPHPFPTVVKEFQSIIGKETLKQLGTLPDAVVACVGGGSNSIGMFAPFISELSVKLYGIEAAGNGLDSGKHSAPLSKGKPGVLHGTRTYLMQDSNGQIAETHSISAGLDYPGVGPEHSFLKDSKRAIYLSATDEECLQGFKLLSELEGIIPALETSHAIFASIDIARNMKPEENLVICLSGRGDKDVATVMRLLN
eukprot:NODE_22_length_42145_cov_1.310612.p3 type:complete len:660 gc:universal NODE_22_length_42145_cov_1.310612:4619-6598(+)